MKSLSIIAVSNFSHNGEPVTAGEVLATVNVVDGMSMGDLISALRNERATEQRDDDEQEADEEETEEDEDLGEGDPGYEPLDPDDRTLIAAGVDAEIADLYAPYGIATVGDLRTWLADGNKLTKPNGVGPVAARNLTELLGL